MRKDETSWIFITRRSFLCQRSENDANYYNGLSLKAKNDDLVKVKFQKAI